MHRNAKIALVPCVAISLTIITAIIYFTVFDAKLRNRASHIALAAIMQDLTPGDSQTRVREVYAARRIDRLMLLESSPESWSIGMPGEFGASDWILYLDFEAQKLIRLRMRNSNSTALPPSDVPPDISP